MIRIVINGILGRMGGEITKAILHDEDTILIGGVDTLETFHNEEIFVSTNPDEVLQDAELVIDFSSGKGAQMIAQSCAEKHLPLITGTTGLSTTQQKSIVELARQAPVVQASNFSVGINLTAHLLQKTARVLDGGFEVEIIETHHRKKKDAPSGTALMLAETLVKAMELEDEAEPIQTGRSGIKLVRGKEIGVHSVRGGSVVGEHQVHFFHGCENITITHQALSRRIFVDGVLRVINWILYQEPGLYNMRDVLNLSA